MGVSEAPRTYDARGEAWIFDPNKVTGLPLLTGIINAASYSGIDPTGTNDSYGALQAALNDVTALAKVVFIPAGTYKLSQALVPKDGTVLVGSGWYSTVLLAPSNVQGGNGAAINLGLPQGSWYNGLSIRDLCVDGSNQYRVGGPNVGNFNYPSGMNLQGVNNLHVENVRLINPAGFGFTIGGGGGVTQQTDSVRMRNIDVIGEWNGNDSIGGGAVKNVVIENYRCVNPAGTGIDLVWVDSFTWRNFRITSDGSNRTNNTVGCMADSGAINGLLENISIDGCTNGIIFESATGTGITSGPPTNIRMRNLRITNSQKSGIFFNTASGTNKYPQSIEIGSTYIDGWNLGGGGSVAAIVLNGGDNITITDVLLGVNSGGGGAYAMIFSADTNGRKITNLSLRNNDIRQCGTSIYAPGVDFPSARIRHNAGLNPYGPNAPDGSAQPAVPASGTAVTNGQGVDATVYFTGFTPNAPWQVSGVNIVFNGGSGMIRVPAGGSITPFFSAAGTWKWMYD